MRNLHLDYQNRPRIYGLSPEDRQMLVQRHFEAGAMRRAYANANLAAAVALGAKLRALKEG